MLSTLGERVQNIRLQIHQPSGNMVRVGQKGPLVDWHLHNSKTLRTILRHPEHNLGSTYVRGEWDTDTGRLPELVQALIPGDAKRGFFRNRSRLHRLRARMPKALQQQQPPNWQDISVWVSRICLGEELFQGCAQFSEPGFTLEQAQRSRCHKLLAQLQLEPGQHVLDLNAGWGATALFLAEQADVRVTAVVRTGQQLQHARSEIRRRGLDAQVRCRLGSFHQCRGRFDRILAGGFLEQHPESSYPVLFKRFEELLEDDGLAWLQVAARNSGLSNRWYQAQLLSRYSLPTLADLATAPQSSGLRTLLLEDQGSHWLKTAENRGLRLYRHRAAISQRFGERRTRHWEFMLASETAALRRQQLTSFELVVGNRRSRWPAQDQGTETGIEDLPLDLANTIPGLARGI